MIFQISDIPLQRNSTSSNGYISSSSSISGNIAIPDYLTLKGLSLVNGSKTVNLLVDLNGCLSVDNTLYSTGEIMAFSSGGTSSGGTSSGGLISQVFNYSNLGNSFNNNDFTNTFNAYTINQLNNRLVSVEGGSATTINTNGTGNGVGSITKSGNTITQNLSSFITTDGGTIEGGLDVKDTINTKTLKIGITGQTLNITSWNNNGGVWLNFPTSSTPSGIGTGGVGGNAWVASVGSNGQWFNDSHAGDLAYRNSLGNILIGTNGEHSTLCINNGVGVGKTPAGYILDVSDSINTDSYLYAKDGVVVYGLNSQFNDEGLILGCNENYTQNEVGLYTQNDGKMIVGAYGETDNNYNITNFSFGENSINYDLTTSNLYLNKNTTVHGDFEIDKETPIIKLNASVDSISKIDFYDDETEISSIKNNCSDGEFTIKSNFPIVFRNELNNNLFQIDDYLGTTFHTKVNISGNTSITGNTSVYGNILSTGEITAYSTSDIKLKENIKSITNGLEIINKLKPVQYNWNKKAKELNTNKTDKTDVGLIAQQLENILPELVHGVYNDEYKSIDYIKLIPYLIVSIQELTKEINELKNNK